MADLSDEKIKLHIGGQEYREGWKILDALPGPIVDYVGNCNDLSFLKDESCLEVYASHVFEHLGYNGEVQKALLEVYRILSPGGVLRVAVPDLDTLCKLYVHPANTPKGRFEVMRMIYGGRMTPYDMHHGGFNAELLAAYLHEAGFRQIGRVKSFGLFNDTSEFTFGQTPISLNVIAHKPV